MSKRISKDDIQVKNAMRDIDFSYQRIAELQELLTSDNINVAFQAKNLIQFFKTRIKINQDALVKCGIMKFNE